MRRAEAHGRRGRARRHGAPILLIAGVVYLVMSAHGEAAPPDIVTTGTPLSYTENAAATAVDGALTITDVDGDDTVDSATVTISANYQNGEDVLAFSNQLGISGSWSAGGGVLTLTGSTTPADYETALRTVTYQNTSDDPDTSTRTVTFAVTDGEAETDSGTRDIDVTAVDDPIDVTATGGSLAYTENAGAQVLDAGMTVTDPDDNVTGASVQITGNAAIAEDVLAFSNQLGISGSWTAGTSTLSLTGTTSAANYQTALRTVTYANTSDSPSVLPRTVTFTVTSSGSDAASRVVGITASNDAPSAGGAVTVTDPGGGAANVVEDSTPGAANIRLTPTTLADVDSSAPTQVRIISVTGGTIAQSDGSAIGLGASGSVLSLSGGVLDLRFTPAANRETAASFDYVMVDASSASINSAASTATVPIVAVDDVPLVSVTGSSLSYTENASATAVDAGLTVTDIDSTNLTGATVAIAANYASGQDVLAFTNQLGITGSYVGGVMTLSGTTTVANYQTALRSVTYSNTSEDPSTSTRTLAFTASDATNPSNVATRSLTVAAANDVPVAAATGGNAAYTENASAVVLDAGFTNSDVDNANLAGASLQITGNFASGEDVLAFTNQSGITGSWNAGSGLLTLTGSATVANYQAAIRTVTYVDTSDDPSTTARTVTITVTDGTGTSAPTTRGVTVSAVNDAPTITPTGTPLSYTENAAATAVDGALTVDDLDDASLTDATVAISSGYWNGEDELAFTNQSGITGSWDATSGALTLTGSATVAQYQTALRGVTYVDTSDNPHAAARTVTFTTSDSALTSAPVTRDITVVPVNDLPYASLAGGTVSYVEDDAPVALDGAATVTDPDDATLPSATIQITSGYHNGQDVLGGTAGGGITGSWDAASGTLTLGGAASPASYQTVLRSIVFWNTSQHPADGARVVTVTLADASGPGGSVTRTVNVSDVDDAPVAVDDSDTTFEAVGITVDVLDNDTDIEDDDLSIAAVDDPAHATATITSDDKLHVVPDSDFDGQMSIGYTVSDGTDTDTGTLALTVIPVADLGVDVTAAPNPVTVGDDILVDVGAGNDGPGLAVDPVAYFDVGSAHLITGVHSDDGTCSYIGHQGRCDFVDIAAGDTVRATVAVRTGAVGTLSVGAIVTGAPLDLHLSDNADNAAVTVRSRARTTPGATTTTTRPSSTPSSTSSTSTSTSSSSSSTSTTMHRASTTTTTHHVTTTTHAAAPPTTVAKEEEKSKGGRSGVGLYLGVLLAIGAAITAGVVLMQRRISS